MVPDTDGNASVFAKIQESVPVWGSHIQKIECANHTYKCLRSNWEKLVVDKPYDEWHGGLIKRVIVRVVSPFRCAIKMRSKLLKCDQRKAISPRHLN